MHCLPVLRRLCGKVRMCVLCMYVYACVCMYVCVCIYLYVCVCVRMYLCMYVCEEFSRWLCSSLAIFFPMSTSRLFSLITENGLVMLLGRESAELIAGVVSLLTAVCQHSSVVKILCNDSSMLIGCERLAIVLRRVIQPRVLLPLTLLNVNVYFHSPINTRLGEVMIYESKNVGIIVIFGDVLI